MTQEQHGSKPPPLTAPAHRPFAGGGGVSERDWLERTIATVRNHKNADNCWPQWANIFADEIERLWEIEEAASKAVILWSDPSREEDENAEIERRAKHLTDLLAAPPRPRSEPQDDYLTYTPSDDRLGSPCLNCGANVAFHGPNRKCDLGNEWSGPRLGSEPPQTDSGGEPGGSP